MSTVGLTVLGFLLVVIWFAEPRKAFLAMMCGVLFLTIGQSLNVAGFNIYPVRVLCLTGFIRVIFRKEFTWATANAVDKAVLLAYGYRAVVYILNGNGSQVTSIALLIDVTVAYFSCRGLLRSADDLVWFLQKFALLLVVYAGLVYIELSTGNNPFAIVGGAEVDVIRNGRLRCVGSFAHATILGTFGASFFPLYVGLAHVEGNRLRALLGGASCVAIVFFANSGGPLTLVALGGMAWLLWRMRTQMAWFRRAIAGVLLLLAVFMKAPLWYIPSKISDLSGGDGWHRSYLMDVALRNIDLWWLAGMSVLQTKSWFPYIVVTGGADIINYYLDFGIAAGLLALLLFISLLVKAFSLIGRAMAAARSPQHPQARAELMLWGLGTVLAIHVFNWFGMVYFDQFYAFYLMQLAAAATLSAKVLQAKTPLKKAAAAATRGVRPPARRRPATPLHLKKAP